VTHDYPHAEIRDSRKHFEFTDKIMATSIGEKANNTIAGKITHRENDEVIF
jgi:hypothetical protein